MSRIELNDSQMDVFVKMAEGNPGAITAMVEIMKESSEIDPQACMGGLGKILCLDTYGIYGSDIYVLWSDKCGKNVRRMLMLIRAAQMGFFSARKLTSMAHDQMGEINLSEDEFVELDKQVCERLDRFAKPPTTEAA